MLVNLLYQAFIVARLPPFLELEKRQEAWWIHGNHSTQVLYRQKIKRLFTFIFFGCYMFQIVYHHTALNYMKSKKANKKFDFKVFTETGPKTSLITDGTQQSKRTSLISFYELEF